MYLTYLDESGNTGTKLDDPEQPFHYMAAVLVPEEHVNALAFDLDRLIVERGQPLHTELHGAPLFRGSDDWEGVVPEQRVSLYRQSLELLSTHSCVVAHACIDKVGLLKRKGPNVTPDWSPHILAFQFLVEKINSFVRSQQEPGLQRTLLIADETDEHNTFQFELIRDMQRDGGGVGVGPKLTNIVDTVHFVDSTRNRGIQLCDLVAYALNRTRRAKKKEAPTRGEQSLVDMWNNCVHPYVRTWRSTWPSETMPH